MSRSDIESVHRIEVDLFEDPWPRDSFIKDQESRGTVYSYVVEEQNDIIAYSVCWYYMRELHIGNLAVKRSHQRKGIGSLLLKYVLEQFEDWTIIFLEVRLSNIAAQKLYKKFGFRNLYRRRSYYSNGEDALIMVKSKEDKNGLV
jgi:ribosomal-protein-alanine N-acetyltransferase